MAQLLLQGTNFVNFLGYNAWVGGDGGIEAVRVTEWDEPQASSAASCTATPIPTGTRTTSTGIGNWMTTPTAARVRRTA